jgi:hypothetical protein
MDRLDLASSYLKANGMDADRWLEVFRGQGAYCDYEVMVILEQMEVA